jgi:hypothetical protein
MDKASRPEAKGPRRDRRGGDRSSDGRDLAARSDRSEKAVTLFCSVLRLRNTLAPVSSGGRRLTWRNCGQRSPRASARPFWQSQVGDSPRNRSRPPAITMGATVPNLLLSCSLKPSPTFSARARAQCKHSVQTVSAAARPMNDFGGPRRVLPSLNSREA